MGKTLLSRLLLKYYDLFLPYHRFSPLYQSHSPNLVNLLSMSLLHNSNRTLSLYVCFFTLIYSLYVHRFIGPLYHLSIYSLFTPINPSFLVPFYHTPHSEYLNPLTLSSLYTHPKITLFSLSVSTHSTGSLYSPICSYAAANHDVGIHHISVHSISTFTAQCKVCFLTESVS